MCPNYAVAVGHPIYRIVALLCTECVGYAEEPQCASVCPENAIVELCASALTRTPLASS